MTLDLYRESLRCETVEDFLHFPYVFPLSVSLFFADFVSIRGHLVPVSFLILFIIVRHHHHSFCLFLSSLNKNQVFLSLALLPSYSSEHIDPSTPYDILRILSFRSFLLISILGLVYPQLACLSYSVLR